MIDPETDTVYVMSYSVEGATIDTTAYRPVIISYLT